ncbi:MAG: hypothetical protein ABSD31_05875 [Candidatus Binataceae bacterium]
MLRHDAAFILMLIAIADAGQLADPDLWGHLLAGQTILRTHQLALYDPFSYTAFGHLLHNHEWLTQVALAAAYNTFGVFGLKLFKLLCTAATISFLAMGLAQTAAPARVQRPVLLLIAVALLPQVEFRPQIITFLLLSALFFMLARDCYRPASTLSPLIPIFALWANLHGGFLVGFAAIATYTAMVSADELRRTHRLTRGVRLAAITAACALATLANPDGIRLWETVMHSIRDPQVHSGLAEWQPLLGRVGFEWHAYAPGVIIYLLPLALFVALAVSFLLTPTMDDAPLVAIAALFIAGAMISARNMALAVIALAVPLTRHVAIFLGSRSTTSPTARAAADPDRPFNPIAAIAVSILIAATTGLLSNRLTIDEHCPVGAVAFMHEHSLRGNLLSSYDWGNYLAWHVAPQSKIFVDGRSDQLYSPQVIKDYFDFYYGSPRAQSVLDGYPHELAMLPPDSKGYAVVARDPNWKLIYRDRDAGLFARATSPAAQLPGIPVIGSAGPKLFP